MLYDWLKNMNFLWPENFMLFGLIPLLVILYIRNNDRGQATIKVSSTQSFQVTTFRQRLRHLPFILRLLAISALIIALARPQERNDQQQTQGDGIDIMLCLDVSGSMGSRDIQPSRMEVAKAVADEFVRGRPIDRIGLVIFSGEAFSQVPLTTDRNTLLTQLQNLESRRYLKDGTVIGEGLATAVAKLTESDAKSRVIILLTDGKEDAPDTRLIDPLTALEIAKSQQVKIYSIGMGARPANVPGPGGQPNPAADFLDEDLLRRMANETGGKYFRATDREGLRNIYRQIDELEKSKIDVLSFKKYRELYLPFLLTALGFIFLELLLKFTVFKKFP